MKGLFLFRPTRPAPLGGGGPYFPGLVRLRAGLDGRDGRRRIWAGAVEHALGRRARVDRRLRQDVDRPRRPRRFPEAAGASLKNIWQIAPGRARRARHALLRRRAGGALRLARRGRDLALNGGSGTIPTGRSGSRAAAACASTRSSSTRTRPDRCRSRSPPAACTARTTAARPGGSNRGVRAEFLPDPYPEFGQCVHKIAQRRAARTDSSSRTTGASTAATTAAIPGRTSPTACRRTSASAWRSHPGIPTRVHRAAPLGRVPLHAGREAARLPTRDAGAPGRR